MTETFIDTSFVIALVNDKDQYFEKAQELAPIYMRSQLVTTDAILLEIGNSLAKDFKAQAVEILKTLRTSSKTNILEIDRDLLNKGFNLYQEYQDKKWGFVDCISFVVMRQYGISDALTHDRHFIQAGFKALMRESVN